VPAYAENMKQSEDKIESSSALSIVFITVGSTGLGFATICPCTAKK
jgi:hypothetical protein